MDSDNRAHYDWPIDGRPSKHSFTELGNVYGGIQISVKGESAILAEGIVLGWQAFELFTLEHVGSTTPSCTSKVGWETLLGTNGSVNCMVKLDLVEGMDVEADLENVVAGRIEGSNGVEQTLLGFEVDRDGAPHVIPSLAHIAFGFSIGLNESEELQFFSPLKSMGILGEI